MYHIYVIFKGIIEPDDNFMIKKDAGMDGLTNGWKTCFKSAFLSRYLAR